MNSKLDKTLLRKNIQDVLNENSSLKKEAQVIANKILQEKLSKYISELEDHPISREILNGPNSDNISRTLDGNGNLFSFIGFEENSKPIDKLKFFIKSKTFIKLDGAKNGFFNFRLFTPSEEEVFLETPMPFEGGKSWVKGIEKGISGFSNYLYGLLFPQSRSGRAIQSENKIRKSNFKPTSYFKKIYRDFLNTFKNETSI